MGPGAERVVSICKLSSRFRPLAAGSRGSQHAIDRDRTKKHQPGVIGKQLAILPSRSPTWMVTEPSVLFFRSDAVHG
jgi:hypothetical protein